jgi:hypothetical protein
MRGVNVRYFIHSEVLDSIARRLGLLARSYVYRAVQDRVKQRTDPVKIMAYAAMWRKMRG